MSKTIVIDFERLKNPYTGLFTFSKDLGQAMLRNKTQEDLIFYLPENQKHLFNHPNLKFYKSIHNYLKPLNNQSWHLTYQFSKFGSKAQSNLLTIHDLNFLIEKKDNADKILKYQKKVQNNINKSSHIVCISEFVANHVKEHMKLSGQEIQVIYNGTSIQEFKDFDAPQYHPKAPFIFSIGTFFAKKNFHVLPQLLVGNNLELIIAGIFADEAYVNKIRDQAKKLNVLERVHLLNGISDQEKDWYYRHCELFAFPSVAEGFGLPVVEAMTYGKRVLSSKACSLPEVGGDAAFYFDSFEQDAMQETLNKALKFDEKSLRDQIQSQASKFCWDDCAKQYLDLYKKL